MTNFLALSHTYKPCTLPKNKTMGSYSPKNPSKLVISTTKKYIQLEHWWSRSVGKLLKSHFNLVILTNFWNLFPTYKLPKLLTLTENVYISISHVVEMYKKCPKVVYQFILTNFLPLTHSKPPYSIKVVHVRAHILPKVSLN